MATRRRSHELQPGRCRVLALAHHRVRGELGAPKSPTLSLNRARWGAARCPGRGPVLSAASWGLGIRSRSPSARRRLPMHFPSSPPLVRPGHRSGPRGRAMYIATAALLAAGVGAQSAMSQSLDAAPVPAQTQAGWSEAAAEPVEAPAASFEVDLGPYDGWLEELAGALREHPSTMGPASAGPLRPGGRPGARARLDRRGAPSCVRSPIRSDLPGLVAPIPPGSVSSSSRLAVFGARCPATRPRDPRV